MTGDSGTTQRVAGYRILSALPSGGMARVFVAEDERLGRRIALKVLHDHLAEDPAFVARFQREAQAAAGLQHPNIVTIYGYGQDAGHHYIAMEYVEGEDLSRMISRRGRLSDSEAAAIGAQVALALDEAHRRGVIHRDVKPENVLVRPDGRVVVTDFGIARAADGTRLTKTGTSMGTPEYMSPEQAGGGSIDARSDIYSLGILLYEAVAGRPPFRAETPVTVAMRHIRERPEMPSRWNPEVGPELEAVILRCLVKDRRGRYQSAATLARELQAVSAAAKSPRPSVPTLPTTHDGYAGTRPPGPVAERAIPPTRPRPSRSAIPALVGAIAVVLVGFCLALAFYYYSQPPSVDPFLEPLIPSGDQGSGGGGSVLPARPTPSPVQALLQEVRESPGDDELWGDLGDAHMAAADGVSAVGCYAVARLLDPEDDEWVGKCGNLAGAAAALQRVGCQDDELIGDLGDAAQGLGDDTAADALYRLALSFDPDDEEWQEKAQLASRGPAPSAAQPAPAGRPPPASRPTSSPVQQQAQRVRSNLRDDEAWGDLGDAYAAAGDRPAAAGCYAVARLLDRQDGEWVTKGGGLAPAASIVQRLGIRDDEWVGDLGDAAAEMGDRPAANSLYRLALSLDPSDGEWQGKVRETGAPPPQTRAPPPQPAPQAPSSPSAVERQLQRVRSNLRDDEAWGDLGDAYAAAGDRPAAGGCYAVARLLDPGDGEWVTKSSGLAPAASIVQRLGIRDDEWVGDLGDAAAETGDRPAANSLYQLALSLDRDDSEWQRKARETGGSQSSAVDERTRRVQSNIRNDEAWGDLGDAYAASGERSLADGCYAVARLIDSADSEWRGKCRSLAGAADMLRRLNVRDDEWIGDLGDKARELGDTAAAHSLYQLALALDPTDGEWQRKVRDTE